MMLKSPLLQAISGILICSFLSSILYFSFANPSHTEAAWAQHSINYNSWTFYSILVATVVAYLISPIVFQQIRPGTYLAVGFTILLTLVIYTNLTWVAWVSYYQEGASANERFGSIYHLLLLLITSYSLYSLSDRYLYRAPWWSVLLFMPILYFTNSPYTPSFLALWLPLSFGLLSFFMLTYIQPALSHKREDILDDMG